MSRQVELAYPLKYEGKQYKADDTVSLPDQLAVELIHAGRARKPEAKKKAAPTGRSDQ
jgi:hypothetical protein